MLKVVGFAQRISTIFYGDNPQADEIKPIPNSSKCRI